MKYIYSLMLAIALVPPITIVNSMIRNWDDLHNVNDYIEFHVAAQLLAQGKSPYDAQNQKAIQSAIRERHGDYDRPWPGYVGYYYPPWLALSCIPLLPLGYDGGRAFWLVANVLSLAGAGYMLGRRGSWLSPGLCAISTLAFLPSISAINLGQTSPLVLLSAVLVARCLEARRDCLAGFLTAFMAFKPRAGNRNNRCSADMVRCFQTLAIHIGLGNCTREPLCR